MEKPGKKEQFSTVERSSPPRTIVGGRPPEREQAFKQVSTGIQRLLLAASADGEFKKKFLGAPGEAARELGITLTTNEQAILAALSKDRLSNMVELINRPNPSRRDFLKKAAASFALAAATGAVLGIEGCGMFFYGGARPDRPTPPPSPSASPSETSSGAPSGTPSESPSTSTTPAPTRSPSAPITRGITPDKP